MQVSKNASVFLSLLFLLLKIYVIISVNFSAIYPKKVSFLAILVDENLKDFLVP